MVGENFCKSKARTCFGCTGIAANDDDGVKVRRKLRTKVETKKQKIVKLEGVELAHNSFQTRLLTTEPSGR